MVLWFNASSEKTQLPKAREHLKIDENIKVKATAFAQVEQRSFSYVVEDALRLYLHAGKEVVENGS